MVQARGIELLKFGHLAACKALVHGVTTRCGGVSPTPFHSLNLAGGQNDAPANVAHNRERLAKALGGGRLQTVRQVHGCHVRRLPSNGRRPQEPGGSADAMITDRPGLLLTILVADCQAVLIYDPHKRVVANIHSGWRGSVANIIGCTVDAMVREYGCDPMQLLAGVSPSLGPCCAEFINYRTEIPERYWNYRIGRNHFDFWALSRDQLVGAGLQDAHIQVSQICTRCNSQRFFSYRANRITGRFGAVIGIRHEPPPLVASRPPL